MIKQIKQKGPASPEKRKGGQTMILTVLLLSGAILSATAISAMLVLFQLRQASDIESSAQAIFAADAGIECVLYEATAGSGNYSGCQGTLDNGAKYVVIDDGSGTFKSVGEAGGRRTARALEISF